MHERTAKQNFGFWTTTPNNDAHLNVHACMLVASAAPACSALSSPDHIIMRHLCCKCACFRPSLSALPDHIQNHLLSFHLTLTKQAKDKGTWDKLGWTIYGVPFFFSFFFFLVFFIYLDKQEGQPISEEGLSELRVVGDTF